MKRKGEMMKRSLRFFVSVLFAVLLMMFLTACGSGGSSEVDSSNSGDNDLSGQWEGTWDSSVQNGGGTLKVSWIQSGSSITGTYSITLDYSGPGVFVCNPAGEVSGTISGNEITVGIYSGETETGSWLATFTSTSMSGKYLVTSGLCAGDQGTFSLEKIQSAQGAV